MKRIKIMLFAAVVFAVGSSFATAHRAAGEWVLNGSTYELKEDGICLDSEPQDICDYTKTGSATTPQYPNENQNPANFSPNRTGAVYVP